MILSVLVDYGGTKTRVLALGARRRTVRKLTVPSKPLPQLPSILRKIFRKWRVSNLPNLTIGAKSVWSKRKRQWLHRRARSLAAQVVVQSDVELAYGQAFGSKPGILIIAGTGSIALGKNKRGRMARAGGLGPKKGDEGSAFWIGKSYRGARVKNLSFKSVQSLAKLAPQVMGRAQKGNALCQKIIQEAQRHLAGLVVSVGKKLGLKGKISVLCAGGLFQSSYFKSGFRRSLHLLRPANASF